MRTTRRRPLRAVLPLLAAAAMAGCADHPAGPSGATAVASEASAATIADVDGAWLWSETTVIKLPGDLAAALFGLAQPELPVTQLTCSSGGELTLTQAGTEFTGAATQTSTCITRGGQTAATPPFPPAYTLTGELAGRAIHFELDVGPGFHCPYSGSLSVRDGEAVSLRATGRCVVPAPVHPNVSKSLSFTAARP